MQEKEIVLLALMVGFVIIYSYLMWKSDNDEP